MVNGQTETWNCQGRSQNDSPVAIGALGMAMLVVFGWPCWSMHLPHGFSEQYHIHVSFEPRWPTVAHLAARILDPLPEANSGFGPKKPVAPCSTVAVGSGPPSGGSYLQ